MGLRQEQSQFVYYIGELIKHAYREGYELTFGDAWATEGHIDDSFHYKRLALDLNLFINGEYITTTEGHRPLGEYWESLHPKCTWGGRWKDGNHYSWGEGR